MRKKLLALLLAAALALSLLAGCGGESVASALLKLLDGRYPNISIEIDPELEADLRQAIRKAEAENAGDDDAVIRAALEKLVGFTVTFRKLGEGQQGDTTFDLVFYSGSDPDKAAQAAYSQWNPILSNVPADGQYDTSLAMVETNSGVWMLVKATVEKAGTVDKPEPEPVTLKSLTVTGPTGPFYAGGYFNTIGMVVTATYSDSTTKDIDPTQCTLKIDGQPAENYRFTKVKNYSLTVSFGGQTATVTITVHDNADGYYQDGDGNYVVTGIDGLQKLYNDLTKTSSFANATITLNSPVTLDDAWPVNITFTGELNGNGNTITMKGDRTQGLFNKIGTEGKVLNVDIEVNGTISGDASSSGLGAVAGTNYGTIENCHVAGTSMIESISGGDVGGIAGRNYQIIQGCSASVQVQDGTYTGGIAGWNESGTVTACYSTGTITGTQSSGSTGTGGVVGYNWNEGKIIACYSTSAVQGYYSGGVVGINDYGGTVTACYWSGTADGSGDMNYNHGIGIDQSGESTNDNANQVTADGNVDLTAGIVNWETALAGLNSQGTGYTFGGKDMNNPSLTKTNP